MGRVKPRPSVLRALGKSDPPDRVIISGQEFELIEIFKHDSWAATALYAGREHPSRLVVCKFNRTQNILGMVPMSWLGRFLANRETFAYERLAGIKGICALAVPVIVDGELASNVSAHEFIHGHPLKHSETVTDDFFPELRETLREMHERGFAYVDLHKPENILVGDNGQGYFIDFQICFYVSPASRRWNPVAARALSLLQHADLYHLAKHVKKMRPDQLEMLGLERFRKRPWYIRAHRWVAVPFREMRRSLLTAIRVRDYSGRSNTEHFTEVAMREQSETQPTLLLKVLYRMTVKQTKPSADSKPHVQDEHRNAA